jgi:hypothetical protein
LREGGEVSVVTPSCPPPNPPRFRLADFPVDTWVQLEDGEGRAIPLALCVDENGVQGEWLRS